MITLSKAFRLCGFIGNEAVYLTAADDINHQEFWFWTGRLREMVDMKKIHVVRIMPTFSIMDFDYKGLVFVVRGVTAEKLCYLSHKGAMR